MKTLRNILAVLTIMMALPTTAQTTIVKGMLIDSLTQESVPYATVRVFKKNKMDRIEGVIFFAAYVGYIIYLLLR